MYLPFPMERYFYRVYPLYPHSYNEPCITKSAAALNRAFRELWNQHVEWTRMTIISIAEGLKDEDLVTRRLLRNPGDMGAIFRTYYGDAIASKFISLFTDHLVLAAQLVKAAKAGDTKLANETEKRWFANADDIAAFLSSINPFWPKHMIRDMFYTHLKLTKSEAVFRLAKNYASDIATYDRIEQQALEMADEFTTGILKQFPAQFR